LTYPNNSVIFGTRKPKYRKNHKSRVSSTDKNADGACAFTESLHRRLRIRAAESDTTLQDWVAMAIKNELDRQEREKGRGAV
jgi:predicted HicB family RNase H-like nuclease